MFGTVIVKMLKGEKGDQGASGDYSGLLNKPSINGVTLDGNKAADALGLGSAQAQDDLLETVTALSNTVDAQGDDITGLQNDLTGVENDIVDINADITELQRVASNGPFIVSADIDITNKTLTNVSASLSEIYAAVHNENRPCFIITNDSNYVGQCVQVSSSIAVFSFLKSGIVIMSWGLAQNGSTVYIPGSTFGEFTPNTGITYLKGVVYSSFQIANLDILVSGSFTSGNNTIGNIDVATSPAFDIYVPCVVGTSLSNMTKTGIARIANANGSITVYSELTSFSHIYVNATYNIYDSSI